LLPVFLIRIKNNKGAHHFFQRMQESEITETADETQQSHLLDMGCGRGRIAHHLATMTGGQVSGYNIDPNLCPLSNYVVSSQDYSRRVNS
jgi:cyclopropane fatty-acyl-phospholipid synthase-like methyltransferase